MSRVEELLARMDAEILERVNAIVIERDAELKAKAQEAYDNAVELEIANIKAEVEKDYAIARKYLQELALSSKTEEAPEPETEVVDETAEVPEGEVVPEVVE